MVALSGLKRTGLPTPTPPWLQSVAWLLRFSKPDCALLQLRVAGDGVAVFLQLVALIVGDARGERILMSPRGGE
jgi:hypothetical protein